MKLVILERLWHTCRYYNTHLDVTLSESLSNAISGPSQLPNFKLLLLIQVSGYLYRWTLFTQSIGGRELAKHLLSLEYMTSQELSSSVSKIYPCNDRYGPLLPFSIPIQRDDNCPQPSPKSSTESTPKHLI
jgi:hypothetical protein